jgi:hypothetical protein
LVVFLLFLFRIGLFFRRVKSGSYLSLSVRNIVGTWTSIIDFRLLDLVFASELETSRHCYHFGVIFSRSKAIFNLIDIPFSSAKRPTLTSFTLPHSAQILAFESSRTRRLLVLFIDIIFFSKTKTSV